MKFTVMQMVVLSDEDMRQELLQQAPEHRVDLAWIEDFHQFATYPDADIYVDLLFENEPDRIAFLEKLLPRTVIINCVVDTLTETHPAFVRVNGWPTFLDTEIVEGSYLEEKAKEEAERAFSIFGKKLEWVPDEPGFITPRVVSTIINEAWYALSEDVSSPEEIDTAMKLGTAYPYGPFEWSEKIGVQNIVTLLSKLSHREPRYKPCELLEQETNKAI
jgi:3-hydroxybutyryl-CoA dehydrogenase